MTLLECFIFGVIMFLTTGAGCETVEVLAEVGSDVILPCRCNTAPSTSPYIIWSKTKKGTVWRKERSGIELWGSFWVNKGTPRVQCPHSQFDTGNYNLHISSVKEEDGGNYTCRVAFENWVVNNEVILRIIKVSVSPSFPIWGREVKVGCKVTPWPQGVSVKWTLNNSAFTPQSGFTLNGAEAAVREKATARVSGTWTCVVNYKGKEGRASASVSVRGIIKPSKDNAKVYAAVGSAVTLPCIFSPGLFPSRFVWEKLKTGSLFNPGLDRLPPSFSQPSPSALWDKSASLTEVGFEDEGRYRCAGTLEGQRLTRNIQLVVAKVVQSQEKDSVTLTCQLTDTSEVIKYEWVYVTYDLNGTESVVSVHKQNPLTISEVSEESWGEWTCRFYGNKGLLGNVTHHIPLMSGLSGEKSAGLSHNTAAVVGLSFLLVVLLLILAQMYKNHQRRKRIFQYPALETIVHTISNEREERERNRVKN